LAIMSSELASVNTVGDAAGDADGDGLVRDGVGDVGDGDGGAAVGEVGDGVECRCGGIRVSTRW
jgi:hypothetical protein